jgi:hypothetical protein
MRHRYRRCDRERAILLGAFIIAAGGRANILQAQAQPAAAAKHALSRSADLSSVAVRSALKSRGLDPLLDTASPTLSNAYAGYKFGSLRGDEEGPHSDASIKPLNEALTGLAITSIVQPHTARPGARILYRLIGEEDATALPQLTNHADESIPIGIYYFWSERDGRATSERERFVVIRSHVRLDIEERPR